MATEYPRYVLRNCTIFVDQESKIGQASEVTLPVPTEKYEELRNAGMMMAIDVPMGFEKLEFAFKMTAFDPQVIQLFGLTVGTEKTFMVAGALVDEDGTVHNAVAYVTGRISKHDAGAWTAGTAMAENEFSVAVRYYKLEVDDSVLLEMDPFSVKIGGSDQTASIRAALMV